HPRGGITAPTAGARTLRSEARWREEQARATSAHALIPVEPRSVGVLGAGAARCQALRRGVAQQKEAYRRPGRWGTWNPEQGTGAYVFVTGRRSRSSPDDRPVRQSSSRRRHLRVSRADGGIRPRARSAPRASDEVIIDAATSQDEYAYRRDIEAHLQQRCAASASR